MTQLDQLKAAIAALATAVNTLSVDQPAAFAKLHAKITQVQTVLAEANQPQCFLLVAGVVTASTGSVSIPVTLIPGTFQPAAIQADFVIPTGMTFSSVVIDPIAAAAGKSVQSNVLGNVVRVIVFGLNQNPIAEGLDFTLNFQAGTTGMFPILMQNPGAADGTGHTLPLCMTSGIATVQ